MRRFAATLAVGLLAIALPGCSGPKGGAAPQVPDANGAVTGADGNVTLALPAWAVGDHWDYGLEVAGTGEEGVTVYVVTEDLGTDWRMDTDSDERAFQDARDDVSRLGPQRKSDLAGSQGDERVEFFRWPLAAGATWATRWDHQDVTVRVVSVDAQGARLTASNATQAVYEYSYDAAAGWFGELKRLAPDGSLAVHLTLLQSGHGWRGTALRYELVHLVSGTSANAPGSVVAIPSIPVPAEVSDLWLAYDVACAQGAASIALNPPQPGAGGYSRQAACGPVAFSGVAVPAPMAGTWSFTMSFADGASLPEGATASYELLARTRTEVPVPLH